MAISLFILFNENIFYNFYYIQISVFINVSLKRTNHFIYIQAKIRFHNRIHMTSGRKFTSLDHIWTNWSFDLWFTLVVNNLTETICCFNICAFTLTFANTPPSFTLSDKQILGRSFHDPVHLIKKKTPKTGTKKSQYICLFKMSIKGPVRIIKNIKFCT